MKLLVKIGFYSITMWVPYLIVAILSWDFEFHFGAGYEFIGFGRLLSEHITTMVAIALFLMNFVVLWFLDYSVNQASADDIDKVNNIQNADYESTSFLASFFIPLVSFNLPSHRHSLVLLLLFIFMGVIYVRCNLFYQNPTLSLLGYRIYVLADKSVFLITRDELTKGNQYRYIELAGNIRFSKKL